MKAVIESSYPLRDGNITSYHSFPKFSKEIEETLVRQLKFLEKNDKRPYKLKLTIEG